jgi:Na+-driven multidrug efflux pump
VRRFDILPAKGARGPDARAIRELMALAWPTSAQFVLRITAMLLVNSLVARFYSTEADQTATTAMGLVFRVDSVALFVAMGWGGAAQTFVGQNLGAGKRDRASRAGVLAAVYDAAMNLAFLALLAYHAERVLRFFGKADAPVAIGLQYLRIVGPSYVGLGVGIVLGNAMAGARAAKLAFRIDLGVLVGFQLPLCLAGVLLVHMRLTSLFACVAATAFAGALVYAVFYARRTWLTGALEPVAAEAGTPGAHETEGAATGEGA